MVYALIYTLFLGFGLQFGSDLFLLFDPSARHELDTLAARAAAATTRGGQGLWLSAGVRREGGDQPAHAITAAVAAHDRIGQGRGRHEQLERPFAVAAFILIQGHEPVLPMGVVEITTQHVWYRQEPLRSNQGGRRALRGIRTA